MGCCYNSSGQANTQKKTRKKTNCGVYPLGLLEMLQATVVGIVGVGVAVVRVIAKVCRARLAGARSW